MCADGDVFVFQAGYVLGRVGPGYCEVGITVQHRRLFCYCFQSSGAGTSVMYYDMLLVVVLASIDLVLYFMFVFCCVLRGCCVCLDLSCLAGSGALTVSLVG